MKTETQNQIVFLRGKKTILRPIEEADLARCVKWINDPEVAKYLIRHWPMNMLAEKKWLEGTSTGSRDKIVLAITTLDGVHIGNMGFHDIDWTNRVAISGAIIGEKEFWGKGYGTDAKMQLLNYAFNTLNLRKLRSEVIAFNGRSLAYSLHCGYKEEGRFKAQIFRDGEYHDLVHLALFREDWLPHWQKYLLSRSRRKNK